jgi:hypothetical protein
MMPLLPLLRLKGVVRGQEFDHQDDSPKACLDGACLAEFVPALLV